MLVPPHHDVYPSTFASLTLNNEDCLGFILSIPNILNDSTSICPQST